MASPIRESLLASNDEFRHLAEEHAQNAAQLDVLLNKPYPSDEDKVEEARLKKVKLRLKDQMQQIESEYLHTHPEVVV